MAYTKVPTEMGGDSDFRTYPVGHRFRRLGLDLGTGVGCHWHYNTAECVRPSALISVCDEII